MKIVCIGGGPAGLYFALLMKQQNPAHDITVVERNRPYDTFGWGVVFSDQTLGNLQRWPTRDTAAQIHRAPSTTGTTSRSTFSGRKIALRRPRLLRHRPQAAAQHPAGALRGARRQAGVRDRRRRATTSSPTPTSIIASDGLNSRIRTQLRRDLPARHRHAPNAASSGSARTSCSTPSPSPSRRPSTAGSRRTPTSSTTRPRPSSSRRRRRSGEAPAWTRWRRKSPSPSASGCSPSTWTATR